MSTSSLAVTEFTSSAVLVWLIEQLKRYSLFAALGSGMARLVSIAWAFLSALLISWEWTTGPNGEHSLVLVFPGLAGIVTLLWRWLEQFAEQEVIYRATAAQAPAASPVAGLKELPSK